MELAVPFNAVRARRAPRDARITEDRQPQLRSLHASSPGLHAQLSPRRQSAPKTSCRLPHPRSRNRRRGVVESHHGRWPIPQGIYPQPPRTAFVVRSRIANLSFRVVARRKRGDSRRKVGRIDSSPAISACQRWRARSGGKESLQGRRTDPRRWIPAQLIRTPLLYGISTQIVHLFGSDSSPFVICAVTASRCFPGSNKSSGVVAVMSLTTPLAPAGGGNDINFVLFATPAEMSYRLNCVTQVFAVFAGHTGVCVKS